MTPTHMGGGGLSHPTAAQVPAATEVAGPIQASIQADLRSLPSDFRLVRVGPDKRPIAGPNWFDDDYSPDDAANLNGSDPPAWGLKSGPGSGVVVLDLDAEGWRESFLEVTDHTVEDLPPTIGWTSGKPGRSGHAYQVDPEWWSHLANRRSWKNSSGETCWELRWDRHQSVIIGAHPETGRYGWLPGQSPRDIPDPAPAPDWLLNALLVQELPNVAPVAPSAADANRALAMLQCLPPARFTSYADWLRVGMALHHTDAGLLNAWVDWCRPMHNFDEAECLKKWESFGKGQKGRPATIATLHHLAKQHDYREPRKKRGDQQQPSQEAQRKPEEHPFIKRADTAARWGKRKLSHARCMACFDRCVEVQAKQERNSLRRRARLLKAAHDLGLQRYINRDEIAQKVLEAKARCSGEGFKPLTASDRAAMPKPVVRWLVPGLIPANDLTIIGGRPKVGKTRVAVAIVAALVRGEPFLEFQPATVTPPPVLLVTDDQSAGDTGQMLTALDLWNHPLLIWSEHFRLTEADLDGLLEVIKARPGILVVLDSLRSIGRALQHGENDPEIGATLYDLKQAVVDAGGTLLLIHHCNKAADLVGVEALSGHNAIGGAANTVITLHHCPNAKGLPDKINPQRRLFSEGRSGAGCDVVIDRASSGSFRQVSTFEHWQQQLAEARKNQKLERLTELQQQALDALDDSGQWMTRRQVCEALDLPWGDRSGQSKEAKNLAKGLTRLVELGAIESANAGREVTYRSCGTQKEWGSSRSTSGANGFGDSVDRGSTGDLGGSRGSSAKGPDPLIPLIPLIPSGGDQGNPLAPLVDPLDPLDPARNSPPHPDWLPHLLAIRAANPEQSPSVYANQLMTQHCINVDGRRVRELLQAHEAA